MSYKDLKSYQSAIIICDFTAEFVKLYIDPKSRTRDQMEQAARSGKQNIVEGSSERSDKMELNLVSVARASFEELLEDYRDFLRQRGFPEWGLNSPKAREVRNLAYTTDKSYETYRSYMSEPDTAANAMVCLINQCNFLLDRQIKTLEKKYVEGDSWEDQLKKKRVESEKRSIWNSFSDRW